LNRKRQQKSPKSLKTKGFSEFSGSFQNHEKVSVVAWGGIEPPTQGFSTLIDRVLPVYFQALAAWLKVGVRFLALHNTQG